MWLKLGEAGLGHIQIAQILGYPTGLQAWSRDRIGTPSSRVPAWTMLRRIGTVTPGLHASDISASKVSNNLL